MKKYFSYFLVMILSCTVLFTTSCSDDDDHPYQSVIDDSSPRLIFDNINTKLNIRSMLSTYDDVNRTYIEGAGNGVVNVIFSYTGDSKVGVKQEPTVTVWDGSKNITYTPNDISKFEIVKVQEPKGEEFGKIWIVAKIKDKETGEEKELVFVNDYLVGGKK